MITIKCIISGKTLCQFRRFALIVLVALVSVPVSASAVIINGYDWDYAYTGADLPLASDSSWTVFKNVGATAVRDGASLVLTSPPPPAPASHGIYYTASATEWAPVADGGAAIEFRLKIDSIYSGMRFGTVLYAVTKEGGMLFYVGADGIYLHPGTSTTPAVAVDTSEFKTYRITLNTASNTFSFYVDGALELSDISFNTEIKSDALRFGDPGTVAGGVASYEYVAWSNATAPVPEPAVAMLTLSGIAVLGGHRMLKCRRN